MSANKKTKKKTSNFLSLYIIIGCIAIGIGIIVTNMDSNHKVIIAGRDYFALVKSYSIDIYNSMKAPPALNDKITTTSMNKTKKKASKKKSIAKKTEKDSTIKKAAKTSSSSTSKQDIPNYFEYIEMAKAKKWVPIDPLDKITRVIQQFKSSGYHHSYSNRVSNMEFEDDPMTLKMAKMMNMSVNTMKQQELKYVIQVLKQPIGYKEFQQHEGEDSGTFTSSASLSNNATIDISNLYYTAMDSLHKCIYNHMKLTLYDTDALYVTKTTVESEPIPIPNASENSLYSPASIHTCYTPIQSLLKLASNIHEENEDQYIVNALFKYKRSVLEKSGEELTDEVVTDTRSLKHLHLDLVHSDQNRNPHNTLLGLAIRNRFYRIIPAIIEYVATVEDIVTNGLQYAIVNGDDFALGIQIRSLYSKLIKQHKQEHKLAGLKAQIDRLAHAVDNEDTLGATSGNAVTVEDFLVAFYVQYKDILLEYLRYCVPSDYANITNNDANAEQSALLANGHMYERLNTELISPLQLLFSLNRDENGDSVTEGVELSDVLPASMQMNFKPYNSFYATYNADKQLKSGVPLRNAGDGGYIDLLTTHQQSPLARSQLDLSQECRVDRLNIDDRASLRVFQERYVEKNIPVLLYSDRTWDSYWGARDKWSFENLLHLVDTDLSNYQPMNGRIPYASVFGSEYTDKFTTIPEYLASMRKYTNKLQRWIQKEGGLDGYNNLTTITNAIFNRKNRIDCHASRQDGLDQDWECNLQNYVFDNKIILEEFFQNYTNEGMDVRSVDSSLKLGIPDSWHMLSEYLRSVYSKPISELNATKAQLLYQWYMGPPLSGAPFHTHAPAFNILVYGRKLWQLLPPGRDMYSKLHPVEWWAHMEHGKPEDRKRVYPYGNSSRSTEMPCVFEQVPGEILYVPRHVTHQVINLAETVGYAIEVSNYY